MSGLMKLLRSFFMLIFYMTPLGWFFWCGVVYISIVDWLFLPEKEFENLNNTFRKPEKKGKKGDGNALASFAAILALFCMFKPSTSSRSE